MRGIASYNIINRKLNISNPFMFFNELKYHSKEEVYENLKSLLTDHHLDSLYETVLRTASEELSDWMDLINNKKGNQSERYLNDLDMCLRSLVSTKHITCNYRTKYNVHKDILGMKIVELTLLEKGREALKNIEILDKINPYDVLYKCVSLCSIYVSEVDILRVSRDELIEKFINLCNEISDVSILEFDDKRDRGLIFNYYEGQFIITNFNKFKQFVDDNDNFKLEKILNELFHEATLKNMELKIVMNALKTNSFKSIYTFIKEENVLNCIDYLTNMEYIRLDYSYSNKGMLQSDYDIKFNAYKVTVLGELFFNNDSVHRLRESKYIVTEFVKDLKKGTKQKNYKEYFKNRTYMKNMLIFNEED